MNETWTVLFELLGGLALFLFGMNAMSDAIQKAAGDRMKAVLGALTRNPVMGLLAGALVTAVLQSSSATTVMVIGFTSAGLMSLKQGISVIFGANIGTTITAQIIAFNLSDYIMPILFVGFIIYFVFRKEAVKNAGLGIFSFGLLFLGIETMGSAMKPLASSPFFIDLISSVSSMPILGLGVGTLMTLVVQSSSATIAVLQNFASQPASDGVSATLNLAASLPILFGDNIGTTITALLASIGQSRDAKRCAIAHTTFNVTGSIVFMFLIPIYAPFIEAITPGIGYMAISRQIANAHTCFNLLNALVWLPLLPIMVKIVQFIIPEREGEHTGEIIPHFLNKSVTGQPVAAMNLLSREMIRCGELVGDMLLKTRTALAATEGRRTAIADVQTKGHEISELSSQISDYISAVLAGTAVTEGQSEQLASLLIINSNISRVADRCVEIVTIASEQPDGKLDLSEEGRAEVEGIFEVALSLYSKTFDSLKQRDAELAGEVIVEMNVLRKRTKKANKNHLKRLTGEKCKSTMKEAYPAILYALLRMGDSACSLSEEVIENSHFSAMTLSFDDDGDEGEVSFDANVVREDHEQRDSSEDEKKDDSKKDNTDKSSDKKLTDKSDKKTDDSKNNK